MPTSAAASRSHSCQPALGVVVRQQGPAQLGGRHGRRVQELDVGAAHGGDAPGDLVRLEAPVQLVERGDGRDELDAGAAAGSAATRRSRRGCCPHETASASPGCSASRAISSSAGATMPCRPPRAERRHDDDAPEPERLAQRLGQALAVTRAGGSRCGRCPRRAPAAACATPSSATRPAVARSPAGRAGRGSRARRPRSGHAHLCWTNAQTRRRVVPEPRQRGKSNARHHHRPDHGRAPCAAADPDRRRPLRRHRRRPRPAARRHARRARRLQRPGGAAGVQGRPRRHRRARGQRGAARPRRLAARDRRRGRARA